MDYSKLSTEDLLALKSGDYSKVSTEGLLALKGQSISTPQQQPIKREPIDWTKQPKQDIKLLPPKPAQPISPLKVLNQFSTEMQDTGTAVAETIGEKAVGTSFQRVAPYVGAAVGTTIAMAPDIIGSMPSAPYAAVKGGQMLPAAGNKLRNIATALIPGGKRAIGAEIGALEKAAGVQQSIPTVANTAKKLNLPPQQRSFSDIVTTVKQKIADKEPLDAQDLVDFKDLVKQAYAKPGQLVKGTKKEAITAQTNSEAEALLNKLVQGREKLSKRYGDVSQIQKVLKKIAVGTVGAGATGAVMTAIAKMVKG